jgi:hypothetical protein
MKLFSLRLTTLKSKLYAIVFASFVVRVVAFFALPNTPSSLGLDEGTYAAATEWTALGKPARDFPPVGAGLYVSGRSLLLPAAFLNKMGFTPLDALRLTSSLYGFLTVCLMVLTILKLAQKNSEFLRFTEQKGNIFFGLVLIFTFLPSHFVWSILGLRESTAEFWVILVLALLFLILQIDEKASLISAGGFLISIIMVFSSRPQVGWVLSVTLLIYFLIKVKVKAVQILIPLTIIGMVSGYVVTTVYSAESIEVLVASTSSPTATTKAESNASLLCEFEGHEVSIGGTKYLCSKEIIQKPTAGLQNPVVALVGQADAIPVSHENNKVGAASVIKTLNCPITGDSRLDKYFCIAYRAPYTTHTFLFRPMLGVDVTSLSSLFAAVENLFWLGAFLFVAVMLIRNRRLAFFGALAPSLLFFSIYSVAAGAYEGNMGTAFRHKSLILWVVILLLASTIVATQQRKAEHQGISDSSKE